MLQMTYEIQDCFLKFSVFLVEEVLEHSPLILDKINRYPNLKFLAAINQSSPLVLISKKYDTFDNLRGKTNNITRGKCK